MGEMNQSFEIHRIFVNLRVIILNTNRKSLDSLECSNASVPPDGFIKLWMQKWDIGLYIPKNQIISIYYELTITVFENKSTDVPYF